MKSLVVAEKPSVATDLAKALGRVPKKGDVYENDEYVIASAVGHLVELEMPEDIDKKKYGYWRLETLPIVPKKFGLKPIKSSEDKLKVLKKQLKRKDIDQVINACDAGREGELIFTYIYQLAKSKLPVKRAWMQTMTTGGIRTAFEKLRDGEKMAGLADAARCRSESDWLIGINGTRALTKRMFGSRAGNVASVGRVQTPTLALLVARELEIRNFTPRDYWRVTANFEVGAGSYEGTYQRPNFKKADDLDRVDRIWDQASAQAVHAACQGNPPAVVTEEKKATTQIAPRLYDLTTLQREANNRFGISARRTLQIAQALYEKHKMITYPRTDSRALPEDYIPTCRETLEKLGGDLGEHASNVLNNGWLHPNKRIFNNAQISDHFAIIPTPVEPKKLEDLEGKVYDMIARRFVATFHPVAKFDVTTRISTVAQEHAFKTEGKILTEAGWLAVYGRDAADAAVANPGASKDKTLPAVAAGESATTTEATLLAEQTKPPARYSEATLLSAMETAGKLVDADELADAMKERGLGTPATRADTIDGLINQKYLERNQRELQPTAKAEQLLEFLHAVEADVLTKPDMTGEWEFKLREMEFNRYERDTFMAEITKVTEGIVDRTKNFNEEEGDVRETAIISPSDNKPMLETLRAYRSQDGLITIYKVTSGRRMEEPEIAELVSAGEIGPIEGFVSARTGNHFPAKLKLGAPDDDGKRKVELDFGQNEDLSALEPFWTDPKTGQELCEDSTNFVLRERNGDEWKRAFRVGRIMCQKEVTREQAIQMVETGKTDLIKGFISKRGRPFDAFLLKAGNRVRWEFPPREAKPGAKGGPRAKKVFDPSKATLIGPSKAHGEEAQLQSTADAFVVTKPSGADDAPRVVFELKKKLCDREITQTEIEQLMSEGKTALLEGFVSKRGAKFSAHLVLSKTKAKADFEFPPR
ncbi:type IA DNA topoisomerase [Synoicihabitans lomoniglobus]|uniref:DNA topoisomerase n=1 Tax=Synoicihabitans lomoniglobus TaxID=2909285 RepID=A0AAF0CS58_9BACT|nr:DNA topoisomerase 3 [Opitutaceae bacterium LMO-M01]WED67045.1 DNA topoisomerase 3 [Opitutaceae bacterium LMO-M01]